MKTATQITEQVSPLTLRFPPVFDVKPKYTVDLPNQCKALVYEGETTIVAGYDAKGKPKHKAGPSWRVYIVNKNGAKPRALAADQYRRHYYNDGSVVTDALTVRQIIESAARSLSKIKTTTVQEVDGED